MNTVLQPGVESHSAQQWHEQVCVYVCVFVCVYEFAFHLIRYLEQALHAALAHDAQLYRPSQQRAVSAAVYQLQQSSVPVEQQQENIFNFAGFDAPSLPQDPLVYSTGSFYSQDLAPNSTQLDAGLSFLS
jgi:hypothetical protein